MSIDRTTLVAKVHSIWRAVSCLQGDLDCIKIELIELDKCLLKASELSDSQHSPLRDKSVE